MDQNDIRRHPSRFLHELGDFGPDLDAIRMLFDWLVTGGQVVATHVVRAQRSLNLGQEPPTYRALCFTAEFITASGDTRVPCSRALGPGPDRDSVALATGPGHSDTNRTDSASRALRDGG